MIQVVRLELNAWNACFTHGPHRKPIHPKAMPLPRYLPTPRSRPPGQLERTKIHFRKKPEAAKGRKDATYHYNNDSGHGPLAVSPRRRKADDCALHLTIEWDYKHICGGRGGVGASTSNTSLYQAGRRRHFKFGILPHRDSKKLKRNRWTGNR